MNFKELLNYPVEKESSDVFVLMGFYYNHLYQDINRDNLDYDELLKQTRVKIKYYKDFCFDGRRVWKLYSVWLDDKLVMVCKNAGREGDDHTGNAVFDKELYKELNAFIKSFEINDEEDHLEQASLEDSADNFFEFYSNRLDGVFNYY